MILGFFAFCALVALYAWDKRKAKRGRKRDKDVWGKDEDAQYFFFEDFHNRL